MEKVRGRRKRVPAFGEWNYHHYSGGEPSSTLAPDAVEWPYAPSSLEIEACSDVWFKYSPPLRKQSAPPPSRKARRPEMEMEMACNNGGNKQRAQAATPARASDAASAQKLASRTPAKDATVATARVVVRRSVVDADLYQMPPPLDLFEPDEPTTRTTRKKASSRSAWMACLGFSCCVA